MKQNITIYFIQIIILATSLINFMFVIFSTYSCNHWEELLNPKHFR